MYSGTFMVSMGLEGSSIATHMLCYMSGNPTVEFFGVWVLFNLLGATMKLSKISSLLAIPAVVATAWLPASIAHAGSGEAGKQF